MADDNPAHTAGANNPAGNELSEPEKKTLTQAEIDTIVEERLARDRKTRDAELKDLKSKARKWDEAEKAKLSEIEKLKLDLTEKDNLLKEKDTELSGLKLERIKAAKLAEAGIAAEWIDSVSGTTEEEVVASVAKLAARLKVTPPPAAQGAGQTGVQSPPPGKKIWTEKEIKELRTSGNLTDEIMADIRLAAQEGRVQ